MTYICRLRVWIVPFAICLEMSQWAPSADYKGPVPLAYLKLKKELSTSAWELIDGDPAPPQFSKLKVTGLWPGNNLLPNEGDLLGGRSAELRTRFVVGYILNVRPGKDEHVIMKISAGSSDWWTIKKANGETTGVTLFSSPGHYVRIKNPPMRVRRSLVDTSTVPSSSPTIASTPVKLLGSSIETTYTSSPSCKRKVLFLYPTVELLLKGKVIRRWYLNNSQHIAVFEERTPGAGKEETEKQNKPKGNGTS